MATIENSTNKYNVIIEVYNELLHAFTHTPTHIVDTFKVSVLDLIKLRESFAIIPKLIKCLSYLRNAVSS